MKSYEEMADHVFRRINEYEAARKRRQVRLIRVSASLCCVCLAALAGFQIWSRNGSGYSADPESFHDMPSSYSAVSSWEDKGQRENTVIINQIDGISADKINVDLSEEDFVQLDQDQLLEYYGIDIFPTVPADLGREWSEQEQVPYGIYKRDGGTGEAYWDVQILNYSNEDYTRTVNIELKKGGMPFSDYGTLPDDCAKSLINNIAVGIGQTEGGIYLIEFLYRSVGFRLVVEGLTQEELVSVVSSLTE